MKSYIYIIAFVCSVFYSCSSPQKTDKTNIDKIYNSLKDGQTKAIIKIDGKEFYSKESIFTSDIIADNTFFRANLFDQFESNLIINFGTERWHATKPYTLKLQETQAIEGSLMIGKIADKEKRTGEGYLMTEGEMRLEAFSKEKCVVIVNGKVGKFDGQSTPEKWLTVEAIIVSKKPKTTLVNLKEEGLYF